MVHEKLKSLRERLEERRKERKGKTRAKARSERKGAKARERAAKERRIEQGNPETLREEAKVAVREAKQTKETAAETVSAERAFIAQELGVSSEHAGDIAETATGVFETIEAAGGDLSEFDLDGDGDTDVLQSLEQPARDGQMDSMEPSAPVVEFNGELDEATLGDGGGMEDDVGL